MSDTLFQLRRSLHRYPELSGREAGTADRIAAFLALYTPNRIIRNLGGHGLAAEYLFSNDGPTILIRCELDALPIQEPNTFDHRSLQEGVSHKCGHDGHMAIVAGLAPWLAGTPFTRGRVILLFQPAEETGKGAIAVLEDERFADLMPDYAFALHNIPGFPLHQILISPRQFSASVLSVAIHLEGKQAHAAEPENGINPAFAIAEMVSALSQLVISDPRQEDFALLTPVHISLGQPDYGIAAGAGSLHYTLRTWTSEMMDVLKSSVLKTVEQIAQEHQLSYRFEWLDHFPTVRNAALCNQFIQRAAKALTLPIVTLDTPFKFGEDFGWLSLRTQAAMFGLGAGVDHSALHHVDYDFPDELIPTGVAMFRKIIEEVMAS